MVLLGLIINLVKITLGGLGIFHEVIRFVVVIELSFLHEQVFIHFVAYFHGDYLIFKTHAFLPLNLIQ
jgi:hypothetical protein